MNRYKDFIKSGDIFIWFTGFGLAMILVMIAGLMLLILIKGSDYYYPSPMAQINQSGSGYLGQIISEEKIPASNLPDSLGSSKLKRIKVKIGNRDIYGLDFRWFDESEIDSISYPENAVLLERSEFGNFHGYIRGINKNGIENINEQTWSEDNLNELMSETDEYRNELRYYEKEVIGEINHQIEKLKSSISEINFYSKDDQTSAEEIQDLSEEIKILEENYKSVEVKVDSLRKLTGAYSLIVETSDGKSKNIQFSGILNIYYPNQFGIIDKAGYIISRVIEFLFGEPRESNTEGGVFPAIFGTVMMVILMSIVAVPFGIIAALYLREYSNQGFFVRMVRIAVNNLAGVPSIVFGVFGLGFFIYFVGGTIDSLFYPEILPTPTWGTGGILWASLTLSLLTVPVVIVSTEEALASIPRGIREASMALGSTKWQTIWKVVLPASAPGILTGVILAMARAAGEVAPLMITGVVKLAPNLPIDGYFPFFHLDRKFMHLGFHIYDVGFQSPNVEAALPMVYMTTLLLIVIVVLLNITAMVVRNRLREKFKSATF